MHARPADDRHLPPGRSLPVARRCLEVEGYLDAETAQAAHRLAWPCLVDAGLEQGGMSV